MDYSYRSTDSIVGDDWKRARRKVMYDKIVCAVTHCSVDMRSFDEIRDVLDLSEQRYRGLEEIPVDRIRGSVGRHDDFTATFLPRKDHMRERWQKVDQLVLEGKFPPIDVYQVDEAYFVVDGNHRVSAARQQGLETIKAYVTEFVSPFPDGSAAMTDEQFIEAERNSFVEKVGDTSTDAVDDIVFTCPGCYRDLAGQVETYRQGMTIAKGESVPFQQAFLAWRDDVYAPAVEAVREDDMLKLFPSRTEADLFIWSWQNRQVLEDEGLENLDGGEKA